jgi:hypothetical protein
MILSLLSMLGGGLMRLLPEVLGFLNRKQDNAHELAMLDRQFQLEGMRQAARINELQVQGDYAEALALVDAQKEAIKGQMQLTSIPLVDALNFLVRPAVTYFMVLLYALAKVAMFMIAMRSGLGGWDAILKVYDNEDRAILSGIISFWFVSRTIEKRDKR